MCLNKMAGVQFSGVTHCASASRAFYIGWLEGIWFSEMLLFCTVTGKYTILIFIEIHFQKISRDAAR